jgi:ectonucleotide pyrophosphatase/phosphodiesterase family protein 5
MTLSIVAAVAALCAILADPAISVTSHPLLLVVSFDGFHPDYVRPDVTPHLARFRLASASPPYMRNVFPTKTFVNHFTVATGLYPETHGVLDNYMFDRHNRSMHYTYEQFHYNENVVPIWVSAGPVDVRATSCV